MVMALALSKLTPRTDTIVPAEALPEVGLKPLMIGSWVGSRYTAPEPFAPPVPEIP